MIQTIKLPLKKTRRAYGFKNSWGVTTSSCTTLDADPTSTISLTTTHVK